MLDLLSLFIAHMNEGSNSLESLFENMSETVETMVTFISFKGKNGIKSLFISPFVHPGPLGDLGGSNMPTILANKFDHFTMVAHGPSTHDFNPVRTTEIDKIENAVKPLILKKIRHFLRTGSHPAPIQPRDKLGDHSREKHNRDSEDNGHDAGLINAQGQMRRGPTVHTATAHPLGVRHRDIALALGQ